MATFTPVELHETGALNRSYRHVSTSGTVYTFQLYNNGIADSAGVQTYITYDTSDRKWRDVGTDHPNTFAVSLTSSYTTSGHSDPSVATGTNNDEYIHLVRNNGYQQLLTFKMAGWSGGSGGNAGGSGSGPAPVYGDGVIDIDSNGLLTYYISSDAPTAQYDIFQDNTVLLSISHVTGTSDSGGSPVPFDRRTSEFSLKSGSTLIWYLSRVAKVFCNFW